MRRKKRKGKEKKRKEKKKEEKDKEKEKEKSQRICEQTSRVGFTSGLLPLPLPFLFLVLFIQIIKKILVLRGQIICSPLELGFAASSCISPRALVILAQSSLFLAYLVAGEPSAIK